MSYTLELTEEYSLPFAYDLQFFADGPGGEKTEEPTAKKLSDARGEGQVAKSKEIANCTGLLALFLILKIWVGNMGNQLLNVFSNVYGRIDETVVFWEGDMPVTETYRMFRILLNSVLKIIAPILIIGVVVAFLSDLVQVKWKPTTKPLKPKFSKFNPVSGMKRLFSANSLMELVKSVFKILLIAVVAYLYVKDKYMVLFNFYEFPLMQAIKLVGQYVTDLGIRISALYFIIAASDFAYQKWKFHKDMKMTKQEVKDEYKQAEGDPQVKGKIKQKMQEASRRRMMQNLPKADVVITNPTHYAVAIRYEPSEADAPIVLAKGQDYLAQRIKEVARENHIEIVENKPLARMLYANVEIGQAVPPELYQAVAEVLAFVYHLQGKV